MGDMKSGYAYNDYFHTVTTTDAWVKYEFQNDDNEKFAAGVIMMRCDSANAALFSYTGINAHGQLNQNETVTQDKVRSCIYFKSAVPSNPASVRLMAW